MSLTIPIPVKRRSQRTLKVLGFGLKAFLTTKVPGRLIIRKRVPADEVHPPTKTVPLQATPPVPDPNVPLTPIDNTPETGGGHEALATVWPEDIHTDLVSNGIKVRDFAYPPTRVGHTTPVHPRPMTVSEENKKLGEKKAQEIPSIPLKAPMPSVSYSWELPHPCLRPVAHPKLDKNLEVPTPEKPFLPLYQTHRIPTFFNQAMSLALVYYRLSESPRTVPIRGLITRRLLTLSPEMIDLSQYHEMDLEELRRYDRSIVWQLQHGIEPYPWYTDVDPAWVPNAKQRQVFIAQGPSFAAYDLENQHRLFMHARKMRLEDDLWEDRRLEEIARENERAGVVCDDLERGYSFEQYFRVWMRRWESDQASDRYPALKWRLPMVLQDDWAKRKLAGECDGEHDADVEMVPPALDPYVGVARPFPYGGWEDDMMELPVVACWGPNAVWDRYRLYGGVPTGKTLGEYVAALSNCADDGSPWPPPPSEAFKRKLEEMSGDDDEDSADNDSEEEDGEDEEVEVEVEVEEGPSRKRARTE
ncbi:hypothetical protein C8F04DRAFT_1113107 [Mycena alexandri]|uniref:Uncharacterized protein n=1 Tax=Mycena alexandri TaxID=1745969 RepID=A0AAD6WZ49_9AGAR|nr:hypothetical protein C8F04DRAFT_1113107 [Mycena alexandri]